MGLTHVMRRDATCLAREVAAFAIKDSDFGENIACASDTVNVLQLPYFSTCAIEALAVVMRDGKPSQ